MERLLPPDFDFVDTGWLRFLPYPAVAFYLTLWSNEGPEWVEGTAADVFALSREADEYGSLTEPYKPHEGPDAELAGRWTEFRALAARAGLPCESLTDLFHMLAAIGFVEHVDDEAGERWRPVVPVPLIEDCLPLSAEHRENEAGLRWRKQFEAAEQAFVRWLVDQRDERPQMQVGFSLRDLATELELDVDTLRFGIANAQGRDIATAPDVEEAGPDARLTVAVDWPSFDDARMIIRFGGPDAD